MALSDFTENAREALHTAKATLLLVLAVPITAGMLASSVPLWHSFGWAFLVWLGLLTLYAIRAHAIALQIRARRIPTPPSWEPSLDDRVMYRLSFVAGVMALAIFLPTLTKPSENPWFHRGAVVVGVAFVWMGLRDLYRTAVKP